VTCCLPRSAGMVVTAAAAAAIERITDFSVSSFSAP
jgi:hypothetical protein